MDKPLWGLRVQKVQRVHKVQRVEVGALMGASINAALRQQEKQYNRPAGEEMQSPFGGWRHHLPAPLGSVSLDSQTSGRIAKGRRLYGQARRQLIRPCVFYAEYAPLAPYSTAITDSLDSQVA